MKRLYYWLIILTLFFFGCNSPFLTGVKVTDNDPPSVVLSSHSPSDYISQAVVFTGVARDDVKLRKIELFVVDYNEGIAFDLLLGTKRIKKNRASWSFQINSLLIDDGLRTFKFIVTDEAGRSTILQVPLTVDNDGPFVSILEPEPKSSDNFITPFVVKIAVVDDVEISEISWELVSEDDPQMVISGVYNDSLSNIFSFIVNPSDLVAEKTGFTNGYCRLTVGATNSRGVSTREDSVRLYINFIQDLPVVSVLYPVSIVEANPDRYTDSIPIQGFVIDDDGVKSVIIRYDSTVLADPIVITEEFASFPKIAEFNDRITGLTDGLYIVEIMSVDMYDTASEWSAPRYFSVVNNIPAVTFTAPLEDGLFKGNVVVSGTVSSPSGNITAVSVRVNDGLWDEIFTGSTATYNINEVFDSTAVTGTDEIRFFVRATDQAGGVGTGFVRFFIDNTEPELEIVYPPAVNDGLNRIFSIYGTASDKAGDNDTGVIDRIEIAIDDGINPVYTVTATGTDDWSYLYNSNVIVSTGVVDITVNAYDQLDNLTSISRSLYINQAADIPQISVIYPQADQWVYGNAVFTGTAIDDDGIAFVRVNIDGEATADAVYTGNGWSFELNTEEIVDGGYWHWLNCRAEDINGVLSDTVSVRFARDNMLPNLWLNPDENSAINATNQLTGNAYQGNGVDTISSVQIKIEGKKKNGSDFIQNWTTSGLAVTGLGTEEADFTYSIKSSDWADGIITVHIRVRDSCSRESILIRRLYFDTVSPGGSLSSPVSGQVVTSNSLIIAGSSEDQPPSSGLYTNFVRLSALHELSDTSISVVTGVNPYIISGAINNFTYNWDITSLDDGIYTLSLDTVDRAGNVTENVTKDFRIMHYPPVLSNILLNGDTAADLMLFTGDIEISGTITDNNPLDTYSGTASVSVYLSDDPFINSGDLLIGSNNFAGNPQTSGFSITYSPEESFNYLIVRGVDRAGGFSDYCYKVFIDVEPPYQDFRYSTAGYYPLFKKTVDGFGDNLWIILNAGDDTPIDTGIVDIRVGTTAGGGDILGLTRFIEGDVVKLDLKNISAPVIFVSYSIIDRAERETAAVIPIIRTVNRPVITCNELDDELIESGHFVLSGMVDALGQGITAVKVSEIDGTLDILNTATGTDNWSYTLSSLPADENQHYLYIVATASNGVESYRKLYFYVD